MREDEMNVEQLSTQIVAINDAIQILARNGTMVQSHNKEIDGLLQKNNKNDERLREIEYLIHQSCDLKTREMQEQKDSLHEHIDKATDNSLTFTKYLVGSVSGVAMALFFYTFNLIETKSDAHNDFEIAQDAKNDKVFQEIFDVMRGIKTDLSDMKADIAVMKTNVSHYQETLKTHMIDEERSWKGAKK